MSDEAKVRSNYLRMLDLLKEYQRQGRFISRAYETDLSTTEAFILVELDVDPGRNIGDLAEVLILDKSTVSRAIARLQKFAYLNVEVGERDRRSRKILLTEKARDFLSKHDAFNQRMVTAFLRNVTAEEADQLNKFLKVFADGDKAPILRLRSNEHPMLLEMRRLARSHRVTSDSFMDSGFSSLDWQIFSELNEHPEARISDISNTFLLPLNTLSQRIAKYEQLNYLVKSANPNDRRSVSIGLSPVGRAAFRDFEAHCEERIKRALQALSEEDLNHFLIIFKKYIGSDSLRPIEDVNVRSGGFQMRALESQHEYSYARGLALMSIVRHAQQFEAPELIFPESATAFGLFENHVMKGAASVEFSQDGAVVTAISTLFDLENTSIEKEFASFVMQQVVGNGVNGRSVSYLNIGRARDLISKLHESPQRRKNVS